MAATGVIGGNWMQLRGRGERKHQKRVFKICCYSSPLTDSYKILRVQPGASQSEVKKAFRQLALQYHPDVCRGSKCGVQFHQINQAYEIVMANLRGEYNATEIYEAYDDDGAGGIDEAMRGMNENEADWDLWEEWMGWEGAGIRDYSSHINPYI